MAQDYFINDAIFRENVLVEKDLSIKGTFGLTTLSATSAIIVDTFSDAPALRVTQRGTGDALVVEDSNNPDSTPFVINQLGQLISGSLTAWDAIAGIQLNSDLFNTPTSDISIRRNSGNIFNFPARFSFSRARGTYNSPLEVQQSDNLGVIEYNGFQNFVGYPGGQFRPGASISAQVDGIPVASLNSIPSRLTLSTTTSGNNGPSDKMIITHDGKVGIGTTSPNELLTVAGNVSAYKYYGDGSELTGIVSTSIDTGVRAITADWQNTFTTVNTYSASWDIDNSIDTGVRAITGDWQNTFTTVNTYSASWGTDNAYDLAVRALTANWENTFTTVSSFSASWGIDNSFDTDVRALTANWENTFTTVSSFSASWVNNVSEPLTAVDVIFQTSSNYTALPEHSGKILHFDTTVGPLTAFFNEPLPEGFNLGVVVRADNPVTIKSTNSTILSQGDTLLFFLDKAFVYKEPVSNSLIALGDLF
jgi:hypothetical protein